MKFQISKEWCEQSAKIEGDSEVGAGSIPKTGKPDLKAFAACFVAFCLGMILLTVGAILVLR